MTKDEARKLLEDGKFLYCRNWWYTKHEVGCSTSDRGESFGDVDEAINDLESTCGGNWENVRETF
jgi:hypothetical protein